MYNPFALAPDRSLARGLVSTITILSLAACSGEAARPVAGNARNAAIDRASETGNAVTRWSTIGTRLLIDVGPVIDSRAFAILQVAIHDAVNGVERRYEPYAADLASPGASLEAAVATAAHDVIAALSPGRHAENDSEYVAALALIPDGASKNEGVSLGRASAKTNLERRAGDGIPSGAWPPQSGPITQPAYVPNGSAGDYDFTPPFDRPPLGPIALFPGWGRVTPFAVDISKHSPPGPDALTSASYARDLQFLESIGSLNSRTRTADQTRAAYFWFEGFPTWRDIAIDVMRDEALDEWEAARVLALTHLAVVDAGIICFAAKYRYRFWRPYTAIRHADEDGNPQTTRNSDWRPLLWSPPGSSTPTFLIPPIPDYPSAAATISAAAGRVLITTLGDNHAIEATSPYQPGVTRRFSSFSDLVTENGMSRVYGGIHFLKAVEDGFLLGKGVGAEVERLLPPANR